MVVYEMARFPFPLEGVVQFFMVAACIFYVFDYADKYYKVRKLKYLFACVGMSIVSVVLVLLFLFTVKIGGSESYQDAKKYYDGNYHIVRGEIRDFQSENVNGNIWKSFYVEDVYFQQKCMAINWNEMFHKEKTIHRDGQEVEIYYVEKDDWEPDEPDESGYVIVRISLLDDDS